MGNNNPLGIKIIALVDCIFGVFVLGWFLESWGKVVSILNILLSRCPCSIVSKIAVFVVFLVVVLLIKSGVQIFKLKPKGRDDHINFSSLGIFILLFPAFFIHQQGNLSRTPIICGLLIAYLVWSIFYLNRSKVKELFT